MEPKLCRGDTIRAILGFLATVVILALLYEPPVASWGLFGVSAVVVVMCVVTAHDRRVVIYGILAIFVSRVIMGLGFAVIRRFQVLIH